MSRLYKNETRAQLSFPTTSPGRAENHDSQIPHESLVLDDTLNSLIHDLRSPLGAARLMADMLLLQNREVELPAESRRQLKLLQEALIKAERMVEDAAEISLIKRHNVPLNIEIFPLRTLVESCLEKVSHASFQRETKFDFEPGTPVMVRGDMEKSEAVLLRVLEDAILATNRGEAISLTQKRTKDDVTLSITTFGEEASSRANRQKAALTVKSRLGLRRLGESRYSLIVAQFVMEQMSGLLSYRFGPPFSASLQWPSPKTTF